MKLTYYLPLALDKSSASFIPIWSRRRTVQTTFLFVVAISVFLLFEYASYLTESEEDLQDEVEGKVAVDSTLDTFYLQFRPPQLVPLSRKLKPSLSLPSSCLDAHIAKGELCYHPAEPKFDVLWTWVNGTDELLRDAKARIEDDLPEDDPYRPYQPASAWGHVRQFRDHDELRFSTRSVLAHFRPYANRFHILTSDFQMPYTSVNDTPPLDYRLGLVPQWLNSDSQVWTDGDVRLSITHQADIFNPYIDTVFNSFAVESQLGHLTDISENFIYLNDDFFFYKDLTPRAFYTSTYGIVFRLQSDQLVPPTQDSIEMRGQWRSLAASNKLLSDRFGARARPYVAHQAQGSSLPILHEISTIWSSEFAKTVTHPFRETVSGDSDPSLTWMLVHFMIERWREALLWSWVVGKHGGMDDSWTQTMVNAAWKDLGGQPGDAKVDVRSRFRETMNPKRVAENLENSGHGQADITKYEWSSLDGYPYAAFKEGVTNRWPLLHGVQEGKLPRCSIDYETCFTDGGEPLKSASEAFKHIAFKRLQCGDCITIALVAASGELGLEAFLPSPERVTPDRSRFVVSHSDDEDVAHLPLNDRWEDGQFAIADVISGHQQTNVREWTLRLLQRYRFMIGDTPSHFAMVTGPSYIRNMIAQLKRRPEVALLCVNDDISEDEEKASKAFKAWAQSQWGTSAHWERGPS